MNRILLGLAALMIVLIVAVIVAPSFIDWTRYRDSVAGEIERMLGRRVVIDGAVEAALVPTPRLSLRGVHLGNLDGAPTPDMAQVEALEVRVALWPLLTGRTVVESVVLRRPVITLEILEDGRRNWQFDGALAEARVENALINDGTVVFHDRRTGQEERFEGINGRFAADSLQGPLRASMEFRHGALPLRATLSTGRFNLSGQSPTPFNLMAEVPGQTRALGLDRSPPRASGSMSGNLRMTDRGLQVGGQFKLSGDDFNSFLAAVNGAPPPAILAQRFGLDGMVNYRDGAVEGKSLALQLGETRAQGSFIAIMEGDKPRVDVDLNLGRIDLDAWMAAAAKATARPKPADAKTSGGDTFAITDNVELTLNAAADALTYRGGAVRQLKLVGELADGAAEIHRFSAQLPGATDAAFNGRLVIAEGKPRLEGQADIASDDFRGLLAWLGLDIADLPAGRLNKVSALAQLGVSGESLDITDLDARFDATHMTGALTALLRDRPGIGANLIVDKLDLDSYLGPKMPPASVLTEFDANVRLRAGQFTLREVAARDFTLDGTLANGELTMRKVAIGDIGGGRASLSGKLSGFNGKLRMAVDYDLAAKEPAAILALTGITLPFTSAALEPFSVSGHLAGSEGRYAIDTTMAAGDTAVALKGSLGLPGDPAARSAFDVTVAHPDYVEFLGLFDSRFAPRRAASATAINLATHVEGKGDSYTLSSFTGNFGPLSLNGRGTLAFDGPLPRLNANLTLGDLDTGNFLAPERKKNERWSGEPIDLDLALILGGQLTIDAKSLRHGRWTIAEPKIEMQLGDGGVDVTKLTGRMMNGQLAAHARLMPSGRSDAAMALDYAVDLKGAETGGALFGGTPIDISGGRFDLAFEGAAVGTSEAALLGGMNGKGSLTLRNATIKGFDLERLNEGFASLRSVNELTRLSHAAMASGTTRLTSARAGLQITDGVVGMDDLLIDSAAGKTHALVAADLLRWRLEATAEVSLASEPDAPPLEMQLSGRLDAPERDIQSEQLQGYLRSALATRGPRRAPQSEPQPSDTPPYQPPPEASYTPPQQPQPQPSTPPYQPPPEASYTPPQQPQPSTPPYQPPPEASYTPPYQPPAQDVPPSAYAPSYQTPVTAPPPQTAIPQSVVPPNANAPRVLSVSPNAMGAPGAGGGQPLESAQPSGRVLSVSPNAGSTNLPWAAGTNAPASAPPGPTGRVLSVSPNAPGAAPPQQRAAQPPGSPRVLNVSPNAGRSADPSSAPTQLFPLQPNFGMPPAGEPAPAPSASRSDADAFARDVLRGLEQ